MPTVTIIHKDGSKEIVEGRVTAVTSGAITVHTGQGDIEIRQVKTYSEER